MLSLFSVSAFCMVFRQDLVNVYTLKLFCIISCDMILCMKKDEHEYSGIRMMHVYVNHVSLNFRLGLFLILPVRSRKLASVSFFVE